MKRKIAFIISIIAIVSVSAAGAALASGAEGAGEGIGAWIWKIINFAILVTILVLGFRKPFAAFLKQRTETIEKTLSEARQARELAEAALKEVEERLKYKEKELEDIISNARISGEAEKEAIVKEAERLSVKAIEQARTNIDIELKEARAAIRAEAVGLAMELAEKKIKDKLGASEQEKLIEESLLKLEGRN